MSTFSCKLKYFTLLTLVTFLPNSNARIDSTAKTIKVLPLIDRRVLLQQLPFSFSDDELQICPQFTVGNNSYNVTERAYNLKNVTARTGHYPWDIVPVYPYSDRKYHSQKCIFKKIWVKPTSKSANSSFTNANITLHSIFQRKSSANLHTGDKCTGFIKFLQIDIQDEVFRETIRQHSYNVDPLSLSYKCRLNAGREIDNSSVFRLTTEDMTIYFYDRMQMKLHTTYNKDSNLVFVFIVQSADSCFLQVQQHLLLQSEINCNEDITKERLKRVCASYASCSGLLKLLETINERHEGQPTHDYEEVVEAESEGFLDLPTIELFLKGLIFPTLILWAANLGYILLKRRMMRQNSTHSSVTSAAAPRYPDFPPPSYEHATCLPTYQEAMMSKTLCQDGSSMTNSAKTDAVQVEINNKAVSENPLQEC